MPNEHSHVIDAIRIDAASGELVLVVHANAEWDAEHLFKLQNKLNAYLIFIESGEVFIVHPEAQSLDLVIEVACTHPPDTQAQSFLEQAAQIIGEAGIVLRHRIQTA